MSIELRYRKGGTLLSADSTNADVLIETRVEGSLRTIEVTALSDIELRAFLEEKDWELDKRDTFFLNGYQSWTDTKEYLYREREIDIRRIPRFLKKRFALDRYGDSHIFAYKKSKWHSFDFFYERGAKPRFAYSLNGQNAFAIFTLDKKTGRYSIASDISGKTLRKGESFIVLRYREFTDPEAAKAAFAADFPSLGQEKIIGYSSWYNYYQNISEDILLRDLQGLDERFNLFQIDDGYEAAVGDWLTPDPKKFPRGMEPIAQAILAHGQRAGIWLAPLIAEKKSELFRTHPEWFKRSERDDAEKSDGNWSGSYPLDLENEEVWHYIETCLTHYKNMGFSFFKLDFLYVASLPSYAGKTRAEMASYAYRRLKRILGAATVLGCGATLSQAAGVFDYLRIGPDVSLLYDDKPLMRRLHRERISTKNTLQNTIYRSFMNDRLFGNDPDVFLLRDDNIGLSSEQRHAVLTIDALFGQMLMTSDNMASYRPEERAFLDHALALFRHARNQRFCRRGKHIEITYEWNGEKKTLLFSVPKGTFQRG